mgnify:CR=1 FL=1
MRGKGAAGLSQKELEALVGHATDASRRAYAPYSGFAVGAALLGASGAIYPGCNVENAAYPLTICAERSAVARAVCEGERRFRAIAVVAAKGGPCAPCGACRQVLFEFDPDMLVVTTGESGELVVRTVRELLPEAFGPGNLRSGNRTDAGRNES